MFFAVANPDQYINAVLDADMSKRDLERAARARGLSRSQAKVQAGKEWEEAETIKRVAELLEKLRGF
jgi:Mrp family chromosome partitioning ATPase